MGTRIKTTKNEALENLGYDKFELLKDGINVDELLMDNNIGKCDCCKSWEEMNCNNGNDEGVLCEECFYESLEEIAVEARKIYRDLDGDIEEPKRKI